MECGLEIELGFHVVRISLDTERTGILELSVEFPKVGIDPLCCGLGVFHFILPVQFIFKDLKSNSGCN